MDLDDKVIRFMKPAYKPGKPRLYLHLYIPTKYVIRVYNEAFHSHCSLAKVVCRALDKYWSEMDDKS